jgi:hypothetical protein
MLMSKITGNSDGLVFDNSFLKKTEPLVDLQRFKDFYLFGIPINDNQGNPLPDTAYQKYIDNAVSFMEHLLDISISPVYDHVEFKDYRFNDYADWGFLELNNYPVSAVSKVEMVYFKDNDGNDITVQQIPNAWIRLQNHDGILRLIPNARFPANLQISETGSYFPEILRSSMIPHAWKITYDYGFPTGNIPVIMNEAIGMLAAIQALILGGNLIIGAGIAGTSINLDGLSQSIQTTQSPENSAFSGTIREYSKRLFGETKDDQYGILRILQNYYKATNMNMI